MQVWIRKCSNASLELPCIFWLDIISCYVVLNDPGTSHFKVWTPELPTWLEQLKVESGIRSCIERHAAAVNKAVEGQVCCLLPDMTWVLNAVNKSPLCVLYVAIDMFEVWCIIRMPVIMETMALNFPVGATARHKPQWSFCILPLAFKQSFRPASMHAMQASQSLIFNLFPVPFQASIGCGAVWNSARRRSRADAHPVACAARLRSARYHPIFHQGNQMRYWKHFMVKVIACVRFSHSSDSWLSLCKLE